MNYEIRVVADLNSLSHHGILGQRWGLRRYQYPDGSLTEEGRKRYGSFRERIRAYRERKRAKRESAYEEEKQYLINYGRASEIKKNIHMFNESELIQIRHRFDAEKQVEQAINNLSKNTKRSKMTSEEKKEIRQQKVRDTIDNLSKVANGTAEGIGGVAKVAKNAAFTYNTIARVHNNLARRPGSNVRGLLPTDSNYMTQLPPDTVEFLTKIGGSKK